MKNRAHASESICRPLYERFRTLTHTVSLLFACPVAKHARALSLILVPARLQLQPSVFLILSPPPPVFIPLCRGFDGQLMKLAMRCTGVDKIAAKKASTRDCV
eukprot:6190176-Pleurochrysis_carterae.AAC.1